MAPPFLKYMQAGFSCVPVRTDGSKAAALAWKGFTARRPTVSEAQGWETRYQGVAIIGGAISGNLEILDIDEPALVRPFIDALKSQDTTLLDRLTMVRTPRRNEIGKGGCHIVYRCETAVSGNSKLAMSEPEPEVGADGKPVIHPTTGEPQLKPRTLIETRGEGGYVLTVGCSAACHPSGNLYEHVHGPALVDVETLTTSERSTIHRVARMFDRSIAETHAEPPVHGYERSGNGESPGDAFNQRATWAEILEPYSWSCVGESGGIKRWRRPGKQTGISATTGVLSKAGNELLTVFSTNAHPFEGVSDNGRAGVTYSKFGAFALLNHGGDYQAAAQALLKLNYGTPAKKAERKSRVLKRTVRDAERRYLEALKQGKLHLHSLGIPPLDYALDGGVEAGEMVVIGGLPSHGKSVCALQALRTTSETGRHSVLVSHEMGDLAVGKRMLQTRTAVDSRHWLEQADEIQQASTDYWESCGEIFLLEQCRLIDDIEREIDQIAAEYDLAMVVVDHAQLTVGKGGTRYEQLSDASGRMKQMAMKHDCVVVVPSQLNRDAAKGSYEAHNLKESGALEQDADVIILARWPWKAEPGKEDPKKYVFKIVKNRNRAIVKWEVECEFNPARQTVSSTVARYDEFEEFSQ